MIEDNQAVIKALNMYGRVPKLCELLEEIERLNNIINELEKYKYAYESIIKSLKGNINFLKRNQLSQDRIDEDEYVLRTLKFYFNNYDKEDK